MANNFETMDMNTFRKVYVVGDIHGCFTLLEERLEEIGFDKEQDLLVSVGDLVDRGPESHLAIEYATKPWFKFIRGNHEDICQQAGGSGWHVQNGGAWFNQLEDHLVRREHTRILNDAPIILEGYRHGKTYGFVHADFPTHGSWTNAERFATDQAEYCMWNRTRVENALRGFHNPIEGVDHVFFGHTPLEEPLTVDNCSWIDTGAVFKVLGRWPVGALTIVDLDKY